MTLRTDREDTRAQAERVTATRTALAERLADLEAEAKRASRAASTRRGWPDLEAVYAAERAVRRAEEDYDIAQHDLATAKGADA